MKPESEESHSDRAGHIPSALLLPPPTPGSFVLRLTRVQGWQPTEMATVVYEVVRHGSLGCIAKLAGVHRASGLNLIGWRLSVENAVSPWR